jgi:hypothetical protein
LLFEKASLQFGPTVAQRSVASAVRDIQKDGFSAENLKLAAKAISFPAYLTLRVLPTGSVQIVRVDVLVGADLRRLEKRKFENTFKVIGVSASGVAAGTSIQDAWSQRLGPDGIEALSVRVRQASRRQKAAVEAVLDNQLTAMKDEAIRLARQHEAEFWGRIYQSMQGRNPFGSTVP